MQSNADKKNAQAENNRESSVNRSSNYNMISVSNTMRGENSESIMDITKRTTTEINNE